MVNNTVNGKKIGKAAGKNDMISFSYYACGKKSTKHKMDAEKNEKKPLISIAEFFRKEDIIETTPTHMVIKAYPGGNPNKAIENVEEITH